MRAPAEERGSGASFPGKILKFEIHKLLEMHWNCQFYRHHVVLYHFKCLTTPPGGSFWLLGGWGGEYVHTLHIPCLRA